MQAVAIVFFRFSHRDKKNNPLTNKAQKAIIEDIYSKLLRSIEKNAEVGLPSMESSTNVKFYDSI